MRAELLGIEESKSSMVSKHLFLNLCANAGNGLQAQGWVWLCEIHLLSGTTRSFQSEELFLDCILQKGDQHAAHDLLQ